MSDDFIKIGMILIGCLIAFHHHCMANFSNQNHSHITKLLIASCTGAGTCLALCGFMGVLDYGYKASLITAALMAVLSFWLWRDGAHVKDIIK